MRSREAVSRGRDTEPCWFKLKMRQNSGTQENLTATMSEDSPVASVAAAPASTSSRKALGNSAMLASYYAIDAGMLFLLNLLLARYLALAGSAIPFALSYGLILSALGSGLSADPDKILMPATPSFPTPGSAAASPSGYS